MFYRLTGMYAHTHLDRCLAPDFATESALRLNRGCERIRCNGERNTKCIADNLENVPLVRRSGCAQDGVIPLAGGFPGDGCASPGSDGITVYFLRQAF